jgi:hypothetical protein
MGNESYCIQNAIFMGITLNLILPVLIDPFATEEERMPTNGADSLSYKSQFMHMMVHHKQVPLMSSLIIALIVGLSILLGYKLKPIENLMDLFKNK